MQTMNKVLGGHQYVANFLDAPVKLGMVFRMDDKQFIPAIHFNDAYPDIDLNKWCEAGTKGAIRFNEAKQVSITLGGAVSTNLGKSEVQLSFQKSKSVAGVILDAAIDSLRYKNVMPQLKELWVAQGFVKFLNQYVFVFDVVTAASSTLVYSEESRNQVVLKHTLGTPVTTLAELGSGNFEFVSNTKRTLDIIRNTAHRPLFKAFTFRKNWEPEVLG
jgi:hypothetical protein